LNVVSGQREASCCSVLFISKVNYLFVCVLKVGALPLDIYRFEVSSCVWSMVRVQSGVPRDLHAMLLWREFLVIVGGTDADFGYLSDVMFVPVKPLSLQLLCWMACVRHGLAPTTLDSPNSMRIARSLVGSESSSL
jgi:hypothetical protein